MKQLRPLILLTTLAIPAIPAAKAGQAPVPVPAAPKLDDSPMNLIDPALLGFGPPGFSIAITASQGMDYTHGGGSLDYLDGRIRLPLLGKDLGGGSFLGMDIGYGWTSVKTSNLLNLDNQSLQSVELQFTAAHFPIAPSGWMGLLVASPGLSSDFNHLGGTDLSFSAIAVVGWQFSEKLTLSVAGFYSHSIGEDSVVPGIGIIWRPSKTVTVQLTPPIAAIGWTPSRDWTFSLAAYPGGGSWAVNHQGKDRNIEAIQLEVWRAGLGVERRLDEHWRINALAGVNFGGSLELRTDHQRVLQQRDLQSSAFALLGVSWNF